MAGSPSAAVPPLRYSSSSPLAAAAAAAVPAGQELGVGVSGCCAGGASSSSTTAAAAAAAVAAELQALRASRAQYQAVVLQQGAVRNSLLGSLGDALEVGEGA